MLSLDRVARLFVACHSIVCSASSPQLSSPEGGTHFYKVASLMMIRKIAKANSAVSYLRAVLLVFLLASSTLAVPVALGQTTSIGGKEHDDNILGVKIGMTVPEALQAVFVNANRKPGQEKPDVMRQEGQDKKDIRVLYNDLKIGKLQIVFGNGKWVKEIVLDYSTRPLYDELRLAPSGNINDAMGGQRYDDRYTIVFTEETVAKRQRIWYRDEKEALGFRERIQFISVRKPDDGTIEGKQIVRKTISISPGDEEKFATAMAQK